MEILNGNNPAGDARLCAAVLGMRFIVSPAPVGFEEIRSFPSFAGAERHAARLLRRGASFVAIRDADPSIVGEACGWRGTPTEPLHYSHTWNGWKAVPVVRADTCPACGAFVNAGEWCTACEADA